MLRRAYQVELSPTACTRDSKVECPDPFLKAVCPDVLQQYLDVRTNRLVRVQSRVRISGSSIQREGSDVGADLDDGGALRNRPVLPSDEHDGNRAAGGAFLIRQSDT